MSTHIAIIMCIPHSSNIDYNDLYPLQPINFYDDNSPSVITSRRRGRILSPLVSNKLNFIGSYGNSLTSNNDGSFDQDYLGGFLVDENDNDHITLLGNAWKAFQLERPYTITKNTKVKFSFTLKKEGQGHAICFENDLNEDTFGGTRIRCLMLAGKQFTKWDNVKKVNLAQQEVGMATQSSTITGSRAIKAVDGNLRQAYNGVPDLNSVAVTLETLNPWWQWKFSNQEFDISEVIIYAGQNFPNAKNNLINFRVTICGHEHTNIPSSAPSESPSLSDTPSEVPTEQVPFAIDSCAGTGFSKVGEDIQYGETIVQDGIIAIPVDRRGKIVKITLEGSKKRALGLAEVKIIGKLAENVPKEISINVFDLMPNQDPTIKYIAFVQDDDELPSRGRRPLFEDASMSE